MKRLNVIVFWLLCKSPPGRDDCYVYNLTSLCIKRISYSIPKSEIVKIKIYDVAGKEILLLVNEAKDAGGYEIQFDGSNFSSGVYFYKIEAGSFVQTKKMLQIK